MTDKIDDNICQSCIGNKCTTGPECVILCRDKPTVERAEKGTPPIDWGGTKDQIREIFMRHGFTIKEGQTDLKDYVYAAALELLEAYASKTVAPTNGYSGFPACAECGKKASDGWALYCVECMDTIKKLFEEKGNEQQSAIAAALHYPACWDTAAYPTLESVLSEIYGNFHCSVCTATQSTTKENL